MRGGNEESTARLRRAGLEIIEGRGDTGELPSPEAAWRPLRAYGSEPAAVVYDHRPDATAKLDAEWHRLAVEHGVVDGEGRFLLAVDGRWLPVRLTEGWHLSGASSDADGPAEFLTLSLDGERVLGVTHRTFELRLGLCRGLTAWYEREARRARLEGLTDNPSASADVLERLLTLDGVGHLMFYSRHLRLDVVDTWTVSHPEPWVRLQATQAASVAQWERMLDAADREQRLLIAEEAADHDTPLSNALFGRLAADADPVVRSQIARHPSLPGRLRVQLAADPDAWVREAACARVWPLLDASARARLLEDDDEDVRSEALVCHHQEHPMGRDVFDILDYDRRHAAAMFCVLDRELAEDLVADVRWRDSVTYNEHLHPDLVAVLGEDPDDTVRLTVSVRPELTEEERSRIRVDVDPDVPQTEPWWFHDRRCDAEEVRLWAASGHLLLRVGAARCPDLPPDVVGLLARDPAYAVRLALAESCPQTPPETLLDVWQRWTRPSAPNRPGPREHPRFPRAGMLRYAADPHPRMRQLALDDPDSTAELVERLSRDPSPEVRRAALQDPRLAPASVLRLAADPDGQVRETALRDPRLPQDDLLRLLASRDPDIARAAAANPALPVAVMHDLLEAAV
ncbi:PE-PGRS family protein [Streptomyces sp. NPDC059460]|uniref:PE-PGRS family protein n=1 Tax=Streptomyces sp. NPDC059460 TaxID=3346840 RepID=UPI0036C28D21